MDAVRGCPFYIYQRDFIFCSSPTNTVYKDRANNKEIFMYQKSAFNSQSTLIGLSWQPLRPGVRLFLIINCYQNNIYLIFYTVEFDIRTKETLNWNETFTTVSVPPRSIYLYNVSQKAVSYEHKINKHLDNYQGVIYLTTNSIFLSYGYNVIGESLSLDKISKGSTEMFGYGEYSGFIESSIVSFSDYIPNIYESMTFFLSHGYILAKQFSLDHQKPPSTYLYDTTRFEFLKEARMINCGEVKYLAEQKMFVIKCLVVCKHLNAYIYTFKTSLKHSYECQMFASGQGENAPRATKSHPEGYLKGIASNSLTISRTFDRNRVCSTSPKMVDIDSYFIPRGYTAKRIDHGRLYFAIYCINEEASTGELMIYKKGGAVGGEDKKATVPYVWASLYVPYQTTVNFEMRYDRISGKETLLIHENNGRLIFYDLESMKLEIGCDPKAVEKLGIFIKNFDGEIAENSSYINLTYNVEDLERQASKHIQKINICLMVMIYGCSLVGIVFIGVFTFFHFTRTFGKKIGYEEHHDSYADRRTFISGADLILLQIKDPDAFRLRSDDEWSEIDSEEEEDAEEKQEEVKK